MLTRHCVHYKRKQDSLVLFQWNGPNKHLVLRVERKLFLWSPKMSSRITYLTLAVDQSWGDTCPMGRNWGPAGTPPLHSGLSDSTQQLGPAASVTSPKPARIVRGFPLSFLLKCQHLFLFSKLIPYKL